VTSIICPALGHGVTRSKRRTIQCTRKAAENGNAYSCLRLASFVYLDRPYAREVGHVVEAAGIATLEGVVKRHDGGVATSDGVVERHDVPTDVLISVVHWLRKGCAAGVHEGVRKMVRDGGPYDLLHELDGFRIEALEGAPYCANDGCEVVGHVKDFKVCPQCKSARYCGDVCQKQDWNAGGHKESCGMAKSYSLYESTF